MPRSVLDWGSVLAVVLVASGAAWGGGIAPAIAQTVKPNPLEQFVPDPLLPRYPVTSPLTEAEQATLAPALDDLNAQAQAAYQARNLPTAFSLWQRELRLRRYLGSMNEVAALQRVGAIAWQENQSDNVRWIAERLQNLKQQTLDRAVVITPDTYALQQAIGQAFETVRAKEAAMNLYQEMVAQAQKQQERKRQIASLEALARVQAGWFQNTEAVQTYQTLLPLLTVPTERLAVLEQIADLATRSQQPQAAVAALTDLIQLQQTRGNLVAIPDLHRQLANQYQAAGSLDQAIAAYKTAAQSARSQLQFAVAAQVFAQLAELYRQQKNSSEAIATYQALLGVQARAYDVYGQMQTYDQIAQVYLGDKNIPLALNALQQALFLAQQLHYQEDYFAQKLSEVSKLRL